MFKGPEAQASIPGRLKVWICRKERVGSPAPCPPLPVLPGPQGDDPRMGPAITGVLVYTCGQPCTCVCWRALSQHTGPYKVWAHGFVDVLGRDGCGT